jgi:hypothetical protein
MPFDGTQVNEAAAHLMRAKQYIEEHGWCPLGWSPSGGGAARCAVGALHAAAKPGVNRWDSPAHRVLAEAIGSINQPKWNDTPGRTVEEVYAAFDRAIALAMETSAP